MGYTNKSFTQKAKKAITILTIVSLVVGIVFTCVRVYATLNTPVQHTQQKGKPNQKLTYTISVTKEIIETSKE